MSVFIYFDYAANKKSEFICKKGLYLSCGYAIIVTYDKYYHAYQTFFMEENL